MFRRLVSFSILIIVALSGEGIYGQPGGTVDVSVSGTPWGVSTEYIGATEGSVNFDVNELLDLGINTYRVWGGMSRWEWQDDDGVYGSPTIAEIKSDPNVINWTWWDDAMINPPDGTCYHWSQDPPEVKWQGNDATIFQTLKDYSILPVVTIRNVDNHDNPPWAQQLNPPTTQEDWNEWWEHVFATVYWFNVRNDYQVDYWEVHNEPDNRRQGWSGTLEDYLQLVEVMNDAIQYVYDTYLPGRTPHVHAPVSTSPGWVDDLLINNPGDFSIVDFHSYQVNWSGHIQTAHQYIAQYGGGQDYPICVSEWGSYREDKYAGVHFTCQVLISNMIRGSRPADDYVWSSHIFSLYDWGTYRCGLIDGSTGLPKAGYYGSRMGIRALQGAQTTYQTTSSNSDVIALTTTDASDNIYLLVDNMSHRSDYTVDADLSALITSGTATKWEFSEIYNDEVVGYPALDNGHIVAELPRNTALLFKFAGGPPDTDPPVPDPMTWATTPYATGMTTIAMKATTATDASGVEYYFSCTSGGGHDSGWQDETFYEDTGLSAATEYCYTVKARDKSANQNQTAESIVECATTLESQPDMYVNDIAMSWYEAKSNYYAARATVWIKDEYSGDVDGATVTGEWSGATTSGDNEGQTGQDGKVTLESKAVKGGGTFTFTVTDVSATDYTYNPSLNVMDSNSVTAP